MIHEFALDPRILGRWETYDRLVNDCGVEHGRLISEFPNRWKKMVWEAVLSSPSVTAMESQRIEFHLQHLVGPKFVQSNRRYDFHNPNWLQQAEQAHDAGKPFRAIVTNENPRKRSEVIVATELNREIDARWRVPRLDTIPRTAEKLAEIAGPLFTISTAVRLVDPYFAPEMGRYRKSLEALLRCLVRQRPRVRLVEVHLEERSTREFFEGKCTELCASCVPRGMQLKLFRWKELNPGERLHRRLVLTDKGGIGIEGGLDVGKEGETTDVYLLTSEQHASHWKKFDYVRPSDAGADWRPAFEPDPRGPVVVNGTVSA